MTRYTETLRNQVESELAAKANKKELTYRRTGTLQVFAYWLMKENVCTIYLQEDYGGAVEFEIPPAQVMEYFTHPFSHPDANLPQLKTEQD